MTPKAEKKNSKKNTNLVASKEKSTANVENVNKTKETAENAPDLSKNKKSRKSIKVKKSQPAENRNMPHIIPRSFPIDLIVEVDNLPNKCKQSDTFAAFTKFGSLAYIQKMGAKKALIGFLKLEMAAAVKEAVKVLVKGQKVKVRARKERSPKKNSSDEQNNGTIDELWYRTVLVYHIDSTTTEDDIEGHFKSCGEIESMKLLKQKLNSHFKIIFKKDSSAEKALKLHNTILKEKTIHVRRKSDKPVAWDLDRTIVLLNPSGLTKIDGTQVTKLFANCGEIEKCDVFCYKNRLAMLAFKHESSIQKALKLNGTTKESIQIEVELYSTRIQKQAIPVKKTNEALTDLLKKCKKSKVCVEKLAEGLTEKDVCNLFKTCGPVKSVTLSDDRSAVVEFEGIEGYCKAFTLHECMFGGKALILQPYSEQEMTSVEKKMSQKGKRNLVNNEMSQPPTKLRKKA